MSTYPKGFFKVDGKVVYATGQQYINDGTAPGRVEVEVLRQGRIYMDWEFSKNLHTCTEEESANFASRVKAALETMKSEAQATCDEKIQRCNDVSSKFDARLSLFAETA